MPSVAHGDTSGSIRYAFIRPQGRGIHCRLAIADFRLMSSDRANWQSAIENWQCQNYLSIACRTHALGLFFRNSAAARFNGLCTRTPWVKLTAQSRGRAREFAPTRRVTQVVEQ